MRVPCVQCSSSLDQYCIQPHIKATTMYHQLYMIGSCILEHRSHYSFNIIISMGMPASSIYLSHIICISPIDGNHINTKTKSHHAPSQKAPPLPRKSYDVHRPYDELLPSHIKGQSVITQKGFTTSSTPLHGSFVHFPTIFPSKTHKTMQKSSKRIKMPPKGHKTLFSSKKAKNIQKGSKNIK